MEAEIRERTPFIGRFSKKLDFLHPSLSHNFVCILQTKSPPPPFFLTASLFTQTKAANQKEKLVMSCISGGNYEMLFRADQFGYMRNVYMCARGKVVF